MADPDYSNEERQALAWARTRQRTAAPTALIEATRVAVRRDATSRAHGRFWSGLVAGVMAAAAGLLVTTSVMRDEPAPAPERVADIDFQAFDDRLTGIGNRLCSMGKNTKKPLGISFSFQTESLRARVESVESFNPW